MKKLLLVFMVAVGFVQQATAGMNEMIIDLWTMHATLAQMRKEWQQEEQQEKDNKKRLVVDVRNILKSSDGKNLSKNLFGSEQTRDLSSHDMAHLINTYKTNRE